MGPGDLLMDEIREYTKLMRREADPEKAEHFARVIRDLSAAVKSLAEAAKAGA